MKLFIALKIAVIVGCAIAFITNVCTHEALQDKFYISIISLVMFIFFDRLAEIFRPIPVPKVIKVPVEEKK